MSQVSAASSAQKHSCCNTHLRPLLERIDSIQKKLLIETERRENEYNELLHILLMIKKKKTEEGNQSLKTDPHKLVSPKSIIRDRGKAELKKEFENFKQKRPAHTGLGNNQTSVQQLSGKEQAYPQNRPASKAKSQIRKPSLKREAGSRVKTIGELNKAAIDEDLPEKIAKMQEDLKQTKELSNYLMQQMLALFERVNNVEYEVSASPKGIPTQQTITSIVLDANQQQLLREANKEPSQNPRLMKLQEMLRINKEELRASASKINQQQNILSDLIALTRTLSSRISQIPLLSPASLSPSK